MNKEAIIKYLCYLGYDKHIKDETYLLDFIVKVSEQFQVSKTAALVRLKILGYTPDDLELTKELYNEFSFQNIAQLCFFKKEINKEANKER